MREATAAAQGFQRAVIAQQKLPGCVNQVLQ